MIARQHVCVCVCVCVGVGVCACTVISNRTRTLAKSFMYSNILYRLRQAVLSGQRIDTLGNIFGNGRVKHDLVSACMHVCCRGGDCFSNLLTLLYPPRC